MFMFPLKNLARKGLKKKVFHANSVMADALVSKQSET